MTMDILRHASSQAIFLLLTWQTTYVLGDDDDDDSDYKSNVIIWTIVPFVSLIVLALTIFGVRYYTQKKAMEKIKIRQAQARRGEALPGEEHPVQRPRPNPNQEMSPHPNYQPQMTLPQYPNTYPEPPPPYSYQGDTSPAYVAPPYQPYPGPDVSPGPQHQYTGPTVHSSAVGEEKFPAHPSGNVQKGGKFPLELTKHQTPDYVEPAVSAMQQAPSAPEE